MFDLWIGVMVPQPRIDEYNMHNMILNINLIFLLKKCFGNI
jgi:hypothetical protein